MKRGRCGRFSLLLVILVGVGALCSIAGCKNKNDPVSPSLAAEREKTVITLGEYVPEAETVAFNGRLLTAIQSSDEESVGCEYWKVRVCSEEEQAKGNRFETDYFIFGEPIDKSGDYALKIKEGVTLPKNLYLGWLYVFEFTGGNETVYNYPTVGYYIPEGVFENRTEIETVSLPQRMGTTAKRAFANCINLKKVYLRVWETWLNSEDPPIFTGVRGYNYYIAGQMFLNCVELEEVIFTGDTFDATGGIGVFKEGFMNCISLKRITFPGYMAHFRNKPDWLVTSVTIRGKDAFKNCVNFRPADKYQMISVRIENEEDEF